MTSERFNALVGAAFETMVKVNRAQAAELAEDATATAFDIDRHAAAETLHAALRDLVRDHGVADILISLSEAASIAAVDVESDREHPDKRAARTCEDFAAQLGAAVETITE